MCSRTGALPLIQRYTATLHVQEETGFRLNSLQKIQLPQASYQSLLAAHGGVNNL